MGTNFFRASTTLNTNLPPTPKMKFVILCLVVLAVVQIDAAPQFLGGFSPVHRVTAPDSELDKQDPAEYLPPEWPFLAHRTADSLAQTELVPLLPTPSSVSTLTDKARAILSENRLEIVC